MKRLCFGLALVLGLGFSSSVRADWIITTYKGTQGEIYNYATADLLLSGHNIASGFPVMANYTLANTQDNGDPGGPFGLGTQVGGLPPGDNNDFVFVGTGTLTVNQAGTYVFTTNTDDGSRVRGTLNGGPVTQIITDDVLSGPHNAPSSPIPLNAGDVLTFDWMWFERGGGAEGEFFYSRNGGPNALIGDPGQGLTLSGGSFVGKTYKAGTNQYINNFNDAQNVINTPGSNFGTEQRNVFNIVNSGGDGDFPGGQNAPGLPNADVNDFVVVGNGYLSVSPTQAGSYIFRSNTDDGGRLKLDLNQDNDFDDPGELVINDDVLAGPHNFDSGPVALLPGLYKIEYSWFERGGGAEGEVSARSLTANNFILLGDEAAGGLDVLAIPEPSTYLLASLGALGFAAILRRRRR